nr:anti-phage dCTP deaminase [uncultured Hyphomonas sp.]
MSEMPEIFIALCGAVGTDISAVQKELERNLRPLGIEAVPIRASALIADVKGEPLGEGEAERIKGFMNSGNDIRSDLGVGDGVARLAVAKVQIEREKRSGSKSTPAPSTAYIINSLKHPAEYEMFSRLYGDAFLMISVYEPRQKRHKNLCKSIAKSLRQYDADAFELQANELIDLDQNDADDLGQSLRDVFPLADIFLDAGPSLPRQMKRAVNLFMGAPFVTPTIDEFGMFHAHSVAVRSADLSRQVGAVVSNSNGDILAMGCNEVPKVGGGAFWEDFDGILEDRRDFQIGYDATAALKKDVIAEIITEFKKSEGWVPSQYADKSPEEVAEELIGKDGPVSLSGKRVASILEYGRIVHAEMSALMDAARRGAGVLGQTLYCTTFPCHMCARHIISAGIKRVVFVEPYPKSLAKRLYPKEICVDGETLSGSNSVDFDSFVGIAPKNYMGWFKSGKRKDSLGFALPNTPRIDSRKIALQDADRTQDEVELVETLSVMLDAPKSAPKVRNVKRRGKSQ